MAHKKGLGSTQNGRDSRGQRLGIKCYSKERVKAALNFNKPDKVPTFNLIAGDIFPVPVIFSKQWKPGWNVGEENLFP